ncbi:MAG: energy transducer TonB [Oleiphilus sp.]
MLSLVTKYRSQSSVFLVYAFLFSVGVHLCLAFLLSSSEPVDNKVSPKEISISLKAIASSSASASLLSSKQSNTTTQNKHSNKQPQVMGKAPKESMQAAHTNKNDQLEKVVSQVVPVKKATPSPAVKPLPEDANEQSGNSQKKVQVSKAQEAEHKVQKEQQPSLADKKAADSENQADIQTPIETLADSDRDNDNDNDIERDDDKQPSRFEIGSTDNPQPQYPTLARKRGWQGQVILGVTVRADGSIKHLTFVKSSDYGVLNYEAYETVRTSWQFKPLATPSDKTSYIEVPITFGIANR